MGVAPLAVVGKWVTSGWNQGLANLGDYLTFRGFDTKFARSLQGKATKAEEYAPAEYTWEEDPFMRAVSSATVSMGASAPVTLPAIGVTLASGGLGLPGVITAFGAGMTAYGLESAQIQGGIYSDIIAQTGDPMQAIKKTRGVGEELQKTMPLYFLGAIGLQNMLKGGLKKTISGTLLEFSEELPTEYWQGYQEAKATQGFTGTFGQFIKKNPQLTLDVIAGTLGQSGTMAATVKTYQTIFSKTPSPQEQFYADMIQKGGVDIAVKNLQQQLDNELISTDEYKAEYQRIQNVVATLGKVEQLGLKGDDAKAFIAFSAQTKALSEKVEAETDASIKDILSQRLREAKTQLSEIAEGKGVYAVVTMPGGHNLTVVMPVESLTDSVIKNAESVTIKNDKLLNKDIQEKKTQLVFYLYPCFVVLGQHLNH